MKKGDKKILIFSFILSIFLCCNNYEINTVLNASENGSTLPNQQYETNIHTYYNSVEGLYGEELLNGLADLMTNTHLTYTSYEEIKGANALSDEDINNKDNVILFYSGASISNTWDSTIWNREHVWCKSLSGGLYTTVNEGTRNAGTDLHQLRPAATSVNTSRNNKPYADLNKEGTEVLYNNIGTGCYSKDNLFEPRDDVKGDVARTLMYMYTHYSNEVEKSTPDKNGYMKIENIVYTNAKTAEASWNVLLRWNELDPVDDFELRRNDYVSSVQGNRNPFIDHPEFAGMIWDKTYSGSGALIDLNGTYTETTLALSSYQKELSIGESYSLTYDLYPRNDNLKFSSSNPYVAQIDEQGKITAINKGRSTISISDNNNILKKCEINVIESKTKDNIYKDKEYTYTIAEYPAGEAYTSNELHVLDDNVSLYIDNGYFSTELRIYSSQTHNTTVYTDKLPSTIESLSLNAGNAKDVLDVFGSEDGENYSLVSSVSITSSSYMDYLVDFSQYDYNYFKLDVEGKNQIRISSFTLKYKVDNIQDNKQKTASDSFNFECFNTESGNITSYNGYQFIYNNFSANVNGVLNINSNFELYNCDNYGFIQSVEVDSKYAVDVYFGNNQYPIAEKHSGIGVIECEGDFEYFKITSSVQNEIYSIIINYCPIINLKFQKGENNSIRILAELNSNSYLETGFILNDDKIQVSNVKKMIISNDSVKNSVFTNGCFITQELGIDLSPGEYQIEAYVVINEFETIYTITRTMIVSETNEYSFN